MIKVNKLLINKRTFQLGPIDLEFEEGYVYAITGNSGSGKTLLLQSILGSIDISSNTFRSFIFREKCNYL